MDSWLGQLQAELDRLETGGILLSRKVGRTRVYRFNPRYALVEELEALLEKALGFYPDDLHDRLQMDRRRPRLRGKPI